MKKIGIVGLGIMGRGIARNFLKKGYQVFVWNRTKEVSRSIEGASVCMSPAEVASSADLVFEITANDESSKSVWTGKHGILAGARKDTILVASATLSVGWVDKLADTCKKSDRTFLDIALTGGRIGAETGNLTLLCGGSQKILEEITPDLLAIAKKIFHFGPQGHGMRYKLILNFLQAVHIVGFGQAMKVAKAHAMDLKKVSEALVDRPGGVITGIAAQAYFKEPDPVTFSIEWITKDLRYAKKLAEDLDVSFLDEVLAAYKKAVKKGFAKKDWARVST